MALTPKQQRFVEEYAVDCCATGAARRAGYSDRTAAQIGYQLLQKPSVQKAARMAMAERARRAEITADFVLQRLRDEATRQGEGSSQAARVRALHLLGEHFGLFEKGP
jgi:phage terminase small subunit